MTAKDHKRKARPIGPATVTVQDGCITVVVPDVLGKNEAHRRAGKVMHTSAALKKYRASVMDGTRAWYSEMQRLPVAPSFVPQAVSGAWRLEVIGVWPRERHNIGFTAPMGDADAAIPQALDALQHAGILDDDARVVEVRAWNLYRKGVRATVMRLVRVGLDLAERDAGIAHLLPLVPPSPDPPAKPVRKRKAKSS